jgi:hypothetical protein
MSIAFFVFAQWWKLTTKKIFGYIIIFLIFKKLDKVYDNLKDWA